MKRKDQNNKQEKATGRRYGRTVRGVSIALALVFGLSSLTTAIPAGATDSTSSSAESAASSGIKETKSSSTDENTTSFATDGMKSSSGNGNSSSDTASTADTDAASEASSTASDAGYKKKVDVEEEDNKLTVTANAADGVLPEDADLTAKPIKAKADQKRYQKVEDQLKTSLTAENQELAGFLAYDISFNKEDKEVEPTGKVNLKLSWKNGITPKVEAADALKGTKVSILHLEKDKSSADKDDAKIKVVNLTKNQEKAEEERKNSENNDKDNKEKLAVNGAKVMTGEDSTTVEKAEMTVDSFSTFVIAWTKDVDASTSKSKTDKALYPAQTFKKSLHDFDVEINAPEGALPKGTTMTAKEVSSDKIIDAVETSDQAQASELAAALGADVTFTDKDGKEIEPKQAVSVTFKNVSLSVKDDLKDKLASSDQLTADTLKVYHIDDNNKAQQVADVPTTLDTKTMTTKKDDVAFQADSFSVYGIVLPIELKTDGAQVTATNAIRSAVTSYYDHNKENTDGIVTEDDNNWYPHNFAAEGKIGPVSLDTIARPVVTYTISIQAESSLYLCVNYLQAVPFRRPTKLSVPQR